MSGPAPPSTWLHNHHTTQYAQTTPSAPAPSPRRQEPSADTDTAVEAWKHVSRIAGSLHRHDLYDLLHNSPGDSQYSIPQTGWPASMRPLSQLQELPAQVLEKHSNVQTVCFCGVFPQIRRAWASVDNMLFLWRLDRWNDVPIVYGEEQQAICAAQVVTPALGAFAAAIRHLLVVCTTTEVVLLGVATSAGPSGKGDPLQELTLQPMPGLSVPSDNVIMACVAGTAAGRVFLGGGDGRLYEIKYGTPGVKCQKVCHTGGLWDYLPSFLQRASSPIVELLSDDARGLLYARTAASEVVLFDLGPNGQGAPSRRAECTDLTKAAAYSSGREVFSGRNPADLKGAAIVHMAIIPPSQSIRLHLLVVTSDGRRVYFSVYPHRYGAQPHQRQQPTQLQAEIARRALPQPTAASLGRAGLTPQPVSRGLEVAAACYHRGALLVAEGAASDSAVAGRTRLLSAARDLTQPPLGTSIGAAGGSVGVLRESITELAIAIPGEACAIRELEGEPPLAGAADFAFQDDLHTQLFLPAPRYVLVSTSGTLLLERRRPVDALWAVLEERSASRLATFFALYTPPEAACMCYHLAAAPLDAVPAAVQQAAASTLQDPQLAGVPEAPHDSPPPVQPLPPRQTAVGFDMGAAVPVAEPQWSGSHVGLALYLQRLLAPLGDRPLVVPQDARNPEGFLLGSLPVAALQELEERLRLLAALLSDMLAKARARAESGRGWAGMFDSRAVAAMNGGGSGGYNRTGISPTKRPRLVDGAKQELQQTIAIAGFAQRVAEAAFLLRLLSSHHMGRLAARLQPEARQVLKGMTLRELAGGAEGEALAAQLISVLITEHLASPAAVSDELSAQLQGGAPTFFKADDRTFYKAAGLLRRAEAAANGAEASQLAQEALQLMACAPAAVDMSVVVPQLALLGAWDGLVSLPLQKAAAIDPEGQAGEEGEAGRAAREARLEGCYAPVAAVVRYLINPSDAAALSAVHRDLGLDATQRSKALSSLLQAAKGAGDPYFHEVLYGSLIDVGATRQLLGMDGRFSHLESYLRKYSGVAAASNGTQLPALQPEQVNAACLLSQLYVQRGQFDAAAAVKEALASRASGEGATEGVSLSERMQCMEDAVLQARSHGAGDLIDRLVGRQQVLELQMRTAEALDQMAQQSRDGGGSGDDAAESAHELREVPQELAALYNDFAARYQLWGLCLEMVHVAAFSDPSYVRQLWDVHLKTVIDIALGRQPGSASGDEDSSTPAAVALEAAATEVGSVGSRLWPSTASFPRTHLVKRLDQIGGGQWPYPASPSDNNRAAEAIIQVTGSAAEAVRVYGRTLEVAGGSGDGSELHAPLLRIRLLRSAFHALRIAQADNLEHKALPFGAYGGAASATREAADLSEIAEVLLTEARRLPSSSDADELAKGLLKLQHRLSSQTSRRY